MNQYVLIAGGCLNIIAGFELAILHMVLFHVHEGGIMIGF